MTAPLTAIAPSKPTSSPPGSPELKEAFQDAAAGLFFGQLLKSLRSTVGKPAYLHGGQAEDLFQGQFDQVVSESLAHDRGGPFIDELYQQFARQLASRTGREPDANSPQALQSPGFEQADRLAQLAEAARRAATPTDGAAGSNGAAGLSALIRK
jgi:Rod binding domain-containing protein